MINALQAPGLRAIADPEYVCLLTLKALATRGQALAAETAAAYAALQEILGRCAPMLCDLPVVGIEIASQLLSTLGDNPDRLGNEPQFAAPRRGRTLPSGKSTARSSTPSGPRQLGSAPNAHHARLHGRQRGTKARPMALQNLPSGTGPPPQRRPGRELPPAAIREPERKHSNQCSDVLDRLCESSHG